MKKFQLVFTGESDLLMHADNIDAADELKEWQRAPANKKVSVSGDDRSPPWTWQSYLYHDGTHVCLPSDNVMSCLRNAGAGMKIKGSKTLKSSTQSGIVPDTDFFEFLVGGKRVPMAPIQKMRDVDFAEQCKAVQALGFTLFKKRARVGTSKHVRVRPRFARWAVVGTVTVIDPILTPEVMSTLMHEAGNFGLGDWRPGGRTPGVFGRFKGTAKLL